MIRFDYINNITFTNHLTKEYKSSSRWSFFMFYIYKHSFNILLRNISIAIVFCSMVQNTKILS